MYLKGLVLHFQKMVLFIMLYGIRDVGGLKSNNFVKFLLSQHLFDILIAYILWTVAQTPMERNENFKMHLFKLLQQLLAEVSAKQQKCTFLDNLRTIN